MSLNAVFTKMCGAGNDFLITDSDRISKSQSSHSIQDLVSKIPEFCHRKFGIGADGVCLLVPQKNSELEWQFFNNDGSQASMCGNAACCIIHYAYEQGLQKKTNPVILKIRDKTLKGSLNSKKKAQLQCEMPQWIQKDQSIEFNNELFHFNKIHSGVDHIVIKHDQVHTPNSLKPVAQFLRQQHPTCNITFCKKESKSNLTCVTFERGVEEFTLACGTGALAASYFFKDNMSFDIAMPGGVLNVYFDNQYAFLSSPVHWIAEVTLQLKTYN